MDSFPLKPIRWLTDPKRQIEQAFADLIYKPWGRLGSAWQPPVDLYETEDAYVIETDLPGVRPENVTVRVEGTRVTIVGRRGSLSVHETAHSVSVERHHGRFERQLELPEPVDADRLEITHEEGTYRIRLPKQRRTA